MGFSTVFQEFFLNCTSVIVHCRARQLSDLGCFPWKKRKKKIEWNWRLQKGPTKSHFFASRFHSHDTSGTKKNPKVARDGHKIAENRNKFWRDNTFNGTNISTEKILHNGKNPLPKLISGLSVIAGASDFPWLLWARHLEIEQKQLPSCLIHLY